MEPTATTPDTDFELDIQIVTDLVPDQNTRCSTDDGCAPTCASSCASKV
jgi:FxLD family lantipeptide